MPRTARTLHHKPTDSMAALYSYVLRYDDGTAPNPFWDICTLTICKPAIRRSAAIGDWVVGTGSKQVRLQDGKTYDYSDSLVYAMKITGKMTLAEYDTFCQQQLSDKIPQPGSDDWRLRLGDCIYEYNGDELRAVRSSYHGSDYLKRDISGIFALLSTQFYYFGDAARYIPCELRTIIKKNQGHLRIESKELIVLFEQWLRQFEENKLYGKPQLRFKEDEVNKGTTIQS